MTLHDVNISLTEMLAATEKPGVIKKISNSNPVKENIIEIT